MGWGVPALCAESIDQPGHCRYYNYHASNTNHRPRKAQLSHLNMHNNGRYIHMAGMIVVENGICRSYFANPQHT